MKEIKLRAYAKINLSIDVLGKRDDGYHDVSMVMQQVDLWDEVTVTSHEGFRPRSVTVTSNLDNLPVDESNIAYKAARLMLPRFCEREGDSIGIRLEKRIPVAAGLAGGSADGAAVLHALNHLWGLGLTLSDLMELGAELGADVPFCIMGQAALHPELRFNDGQASTCALAGGIGEMLAPLPPLAAWVVLSKPPVQVSTAEIYGALKLEEIKERPDTEGIIQGLHEQDFTKVSEGMFNVLEPVSTERFPEILNIKNRMQKNSGLYKTMMSGSGPTVFAVTPDKATAEQIYNGINNINAATYLVRTI